MPEVKLISQVKEVSHKIQVQLVNQQNHVGKNSSNVNQQQGNGHQQNKPGKEARNCPDSLSQSAVSDKMQQESKKNEVHQVEDDP